jgi:hypothetical protein
MRLGCEPCEREELAAYWADEYLILVARGTLPESCWAVQFEQSPLDIWPPQFLLRRCRTASFCPPVMTPYTACDVVRLGTRPDAIAIHHREGEESVPVQDLAAGQAPSAVPAFTGATDEAAEFDEAVGLSRSMSFDEAFREAIAGLPPWRPSFPDEMSTVQVTETGAWFGGIAGFNDLFVRVRRAKRPAAAG